MVEKGLSLGEGSRVNVTFLEKDETAIAYCLSCRKVLCTGREDDFVSFRVMESQMQSHFEAYFEPHTIEVVYPRSPQPEANNAGLIYCASQTPQES